MKEERSKERLISGSNFGSYSENDNAISMTSWTMARVRYGSLHDYVQISFQRAYF
jgi:hypothetical protein